jgi:hypothetical protein
MVQCLLILCAAAADLGETLAYTRVRADRCRMALVDDLILVAKTRDEDNAGTENRHNLTVNIDGVEVFNLDFFGLGGIPRGETELNENDFLGALGPIPWLVATPFDSNDLTDSSIRLGIRGDDAWAPQHVLLIGRVPPEWSPGRSIPLAVETDLTTWLSSDPDEGNLTMRLRLVGQGNGAMVIRRVLLVISTSRTQHADTESDVRLQIAAAGTIVLSAKISHAFGRHKTYWHFLDVEPFTRNDVGPNDIELSILGRDAWLPGLVFIFGVDTETGRPNEMVTLVAIRSWDLGWLSTEVNEGQPSVKLPLSI